MRGRTILFAAAGVVIVGMLVFLAIEVRRGGSSGADGGTSAGESGRGNAAAKRSPPAPRPDRADPDEEGLEPAAPPRVGMRPPPGGISAVPLGGPRAAGSTMAPPVASSNGAPAQDERTAEVSAAYDRGDYQAAQEKALAVLADSPRNIKMLRVVVSTSCMFGEMDRARELNARLPKKDQEDMKKRCKRFGEEL